ncbi:MAG TPA: 7-cyano-7-deazaguanine synthase [Chromatiaceae bacterium]|nr:7-cyano-7-deazaguanine synthase [Chromatiaceae bacterium]
MPNAVVLLSGGLDSTTTLAIAKAAGFTPYALSFRYGQRHGVELDAAARIAATLGVAEHLIVDIDLRRIGGSALTSDIAVPKGRDLSGIGSAKPEAAPCAPGIPPVLGGKPEAAPGAPGLPPGSTGDSSAGGRDARAPIPPVLGGIPITYVPARNTIFLSFALAWAETLDSSDIFIGVNALDYSGYPDCRPEYIAAFEHLARLATRAGVEGHKRLHIHAPLIRLSKAQIIRQGMGLGVDYGLTSSCYDPGPGGQPCGECDSCLLRARGFAEAGLTDPLLARFAGAP